ncbi:MAG: hypothetical protein ACRBBN_02850 [Methyloligellaceae bacterium]
MKKLIWILLVVPAGIIFVTLAVANRHEVNLVLDPFAPKDPAIAINMPLFFFILAGMILGVLLGGIGAWINQGRWRRTARERALEAHQWRLRAEKLTRQLELSGQQQLPPA